MANTITTLTAEEAQAIAGRLEDIAEELRATPKDFALVLNEGAGGEEYLDLDIETEVLVGDDEITITIETRRRFDGRALTQ